MRSIWGASYDDGRVVTVRGDLPQPTTRRARSDQRIQDEVRRVLQERLQSAHHIEVSAHRGVVRLSGHVIGQGERWLAAELAERVPGVEGVENLVRVVR